MKRRLTYVGTEYFDRLPSAAEAEDRSFDLEVTIEHDLGGLFRSLCRHDDFDVAEMSLSNYLSLRSVGDDRYIAIPVFLSRSFRHAQVYVNSDAGIDAPQQLRGAKVGVPEYHMTAGVWVRAFLQHDFGVAPGDIEWHTSADAIAYLDEIGFPLPEDIELVPAPGPLDELLESGGLDALITVKAPPPFERSSPKVTRLFDDHRRVEEDYYRRTGIFPIMHAVVLRTEHHRREPGLALELLEVFHAARQRAVHRLTDLNAPAVGAPWLGTELEATVELFGGDPFAYGVPPNKTTLDAMLDAHFEQGLSTRRLDLGDAFAPSTLDWTPPSDALRGRRW